MAKRNKITSGFAVFDKDVKSVDKYNVRTPAIFKSKTDAKLFAKLKKWKDFKIMKY